MNQARGTRAPTATHFIVALIFCFDVRTEGTSPGDTFKVRDSASLNTFLCRECAQDNQSGERHYVKDHM